VIACSTTKNGKTTIDDLFTKKGSRSKSNWKKGSLVFYLDEEIDLSSTVDEI
jgi:hypothetical protein